MRHLILVFFILFSVICSAETITVQDLQNRTVQITLPVKRIFLINSTDLQTLDIVSGDRYFTNIVGWGDTMQQFFPDIAETYLTRYPYLKKIPVLGKNAKNFNAESMINLMPDIVIARKRYYKSFKEQGILEQLDNAGIKVVFIDFRYDIIAGTLQSINLLGQLLNNRERAEKFTNWYQQRIQFIRHGLQAYHETPANKPTFLLEKNAGLMGLDVCCAFYGTGSVGAIADLAGGDNLMVKMAPANGGNMSLESVLKFDPQYYILSGADWTRYNPDAKSIVLGYHQSAVQAHQQLQVLTARKGINTLTAIKNKRVIALYHGFYDGPLSILLTEALATFMHPDIFKDLSATEDAEYLHKHFLSIPATGVFWLKL